MKDTQQGGSFPVSLRLICLCLTVKVYGIINHMVYSKKNHQMNTEAVPRIGQFLLTIPLTYDKTLKFLKVLDLKILLKKDILENMFILLILPILYFPT